VKEMAEAALWLQLGLFALSSVGVLISALVARSVNQQDKKLDTIGGKVDDIADKVSDHAAQLAEGRATMKALADKSTDLEADVKRLIRDGCAHRQTCFNGNGHRGGSNGGEG